MCGSDLVVGIAADLSVREKSRAYYSSADSVADLLRQALLNGGLGIRDKTVPLSDIISCGDSVLIKPNWVLELNHSGHTTDCSITHHTFVLAVLQEVMNAKPSRVVIADAPIQRADFGKLVPQSFVEEIHQNQSSVEVTVRDLRNVVTTVTNGCSLQKKGLRSESGVVKFDLGPDSMLEEISTQNNRFRVTCYNPEAMQNAHRKGFHIYKLCAEPFDADVVINLPKLKTHGKAGITAALKNVVGLNADKDVLPHHRFGGSRIGGDCYEGLRPLKLIGEFCLDRANRKFGIANSAWWAHLYRAFLLPHILFRDGNIEGKWHGNDTVWRMVIDLNRLLLYGRRDGTIAENPQRKIYSITDGILAGEGNGPLGPSPLPLGMVTFGADSALTDLVHAGLFHFDWQKIPLIRECFRPTRKFPITKNRPEDVKVVTNLGKMSHAESAQLFGISAFPPDGWKNHIEASYWMER